MRFSLTCKCFSCFLPKNRLKGENTALMVRLNLKGNDGEQILPVIYSDNYFHLMPSESKTITITWNNQDSRGCTPVIDVSGFNM